MRRQSYDAFYHAEVGGPVEIRFSFWRGSRRFDSIRFRRRWMGSSSRRPRSGRMGAIARKGRGRRMEAKLSLILRLPPGSNICLPTWYDPPPIRTVVLKCLFWFTCKRSDVASKAIETHRVPLSSWEHLKASRIQSSACAKRKLRGERGGRPICKAPESLRCSICGFYHPRVDVCGGQNA